MITDHRALDPCLKCPVCQFLQAILLQLWRIDSPPANGMRPYIKSLCQFLSPSEILYRFFCCHLCALRVCIGVDTLP